MLARPDSTGFQRVISAPPAPFPAWARFRHGEPSQAEAAFVAGAALARLDALTRENPPCAGAWRQRLALKAAVASVALAGRAEAEPALRDALHFTPAGGDPGPAGRVLAAWRALTLQPVRGWRAAATQAAECLRTPADALEATLAAIERCAGDAQPAPFAAANTYAAVRNALGVASGRWAGDGEVLAAMLADVVLAQSLKWPFVVPLLLAPLFGGRGRRSVDEPGEATQARVVAAYAKGAALAFDLAVACSLAARSLEQATPKLRAKGAAAAIAALCDDDSLGATTRLQGLSERGTRRLFERLVALGALRELTGRKTFRLYGL